MAAGPSQIDFVPAGDDPLRRATPSIDDVEARRARSAIAGRLFGGAPQPVKVGRYRITGRIGSGGMGMVYRAHDPELARDVAVKLMNADAFGEDEARLARARLVREARAMARLAHPNVIHVYDVGTVADGVFIAMELVVGRSLDRWLAEETPDWQTALARLVDAGRGLAAAHAAGVIHRDFKPENVLVGDDGRVRVGDFGLAGGPIVATGEFTSASQSGRGLFDTSSVDESLTRTGALLGTPKYMAPEAESGAPASARSDQFSFCVALYEALYGRPPFLGDSVGEYRHNVRRGDVVPPHPDTRVKAWVHAEIVRGLAVDPAQRHPGMEVLLERLEAALPDPRRHARRRRRLWIASGVVGVAVLLGGAGWGLGRSRTTQTRTEAPPAVADARPEAAAEPRPTGGADPLVPSRSSNDGSAPAAAGNDEAPPHEEPVETPSDPEEAADDSRGEPLSTAAEPPEIAEVPPEKPRRRSYCYFEQDNFGFIQRARSRRRILRSDGQCYDCSQPAPAYRRESLVPDDGNGPCDRYYECFKETPDKCEG